MKRLRVSHFQTTLFLAVALMTVHACKARNSGAARVKSNTPSDSGTESKVPAASGELGPVCGGDPTCGDSTGFGKKLSAAFGDIGQLEKQYVASVDRVRSDELVMAGESPANPSATPSDTAGSGAVSALALDDAPILTPEQRTAAVEKAIADAKAKLTALKASHPNGTFKTLYCDLDADVMKREIHDRERRGYTITWKKVSTRKISVVVFYQSLSKESATNKCLSEAVSNRALRWHSGVDYKIEQNGFNPTVGEEKTHGFDITSDQIKKIVTDQYGSVSLIAQYFELKWTPCLSGGTWCWDDHAAAHKFCLGYGYRLPTVSDLQVLQQRLIDQSGPWKARKEYVNTNQGPYQISDGTTVYQHYSWQTNGKYLRTTSDALVVCLYD